MTFLDEVSRIRILQAIPYFSLRRGGDVGACVQLSRELARKGHDVTVATTDFEFDGRLPMDFQGVEVIPFRVVTRIGLFLVTPSMMQWLRENLDEYDVVHVHNLQSFQNILIRRESVARNVPFVLQAHGLDPRSIWMSPTKAAYQVVWGRSILESATKTIALTQRELHEYLEMGVTESKIAVVPNGLDPREYDHLPNRGVFRRKWNLDSDGSLVLFLGRLHKSKGIGLLIDVFSEYAKENLNARLVIAGPDYGYLAAAVRRCSLRGISARVLFPGPLYGDEKLSAIVDADLFVIPSEYEGFPMTALESWACGTPILATKTSGLGEIGPGAALVVENKIGDLLSGMRRLMHDYEAREGLSSEGRHLALTHFSIREVVDRVEAIYSEIRSRNQ